MAKYIGLQQQIARNNRKSFLLLLSFPAIVAGLVWLYHYILVYLYANEAGTPITGEMYDNINEEFIITIPWVTVGVLVWFVIAYFSNTAIIKASTSSRTLQRQEDPRIYNLVENLCISRGMSMPKLNIIEDNMLNAFASGINQKTYAITLTRGIINRLNDEELEGVIAHELSHIRNKDVRLLIVSIVFVGIFSFLIDIFLRTFFWSSISGRRGRDGKGSGYAMLIALVLAVVGYLLAMLARFAISRSREYLADAGAVELTHKPLALASALRKISGHSELRKGKSSMVADLFIDNKPKSSLAGMFATHPPIEKRIEILEQM